jgi:hypothetical protein
MEYNRPLCRRIAEEAGVPREAFGMVKSAASQWPHAQVRFGTPEGFDDFCRWLRGQRQEWITRRRMPPIVHPLVDRAAAKLLELLEKGITWMQRNIPLVRRSKILGYLAQLRWASTGECPWVLGMRRYVFPWALAEAMKRYRVPQFRA